MGTGKLSERSRNVFKTSNKYQEQMIFIVFLPSVVTFLTFILIILIGNPIMSHAILHASSVSAGNMLNQFSSLLVILICFFLFLSIIAAFVVSNSMVGAFGRIIHELDEIIAGNSQKTITSRPQDTLSADLLKRINVLVKFYVENKKES